MDKIASLRAALVAPHPDLVRNPDRLKVFVHEGRVVSRRTASLAFEYRYTVRLFFAEPDDLQAGDRVFHVELQGQRVFSSLDVVKDAGGRNRGMVKEFPGIDVGDALVIRFKLDPQTRIQAALLSGVEVQSEGW